MFLAARLELNVGRHTEIRYPRSFREIGAFKAIHKRPAHHGNLISRFLHIWVGLDEARWHWQMHIDHAAAAPRPANLVKLTNRGRRRSLTVHADTRASSPGWDAQHQRKLTRCVGGHCYPNPTVPRVICLLLKR